MDTYASFTSFNLSEAEITKLIDSKCNVVCPGKRCFSMFRYLKPGDEGFREGYINSLYYCMDYDVGDAVFEVLNLCEA